MESKTGMFAVVGDEMLSAVAGGHRKCHPGRGYGRGGRYSKSDTVGNIDVTVNGSNDNVTIDVSQS